MSIFVLLGPLVPTAPFLIVFGWGKLGPSDLIVGMGIGFLSGIVPAACAGALFNRLQFSVSNFTLARRLVSGAVIGLIAGILGTVPYACLLAFTRGLGILFLYTALGAVAGGVCGVVIEYRRWWTGRLRQ